MPHKTLNHRSTIDLFPRVRIARRHVLQMSPLIACFLPANSVHEFNFCDWQVKSQHLPLPMSYAPINFKPAGGGKAYDGDMIVPVRR